MIKLLLFVFLTCTCTVSFSQTAYPYQDIKLEKASDYAETESLALSAATFLLATPFAELDANRKNALKFLTDWILGAKNYQFYLRGIAADLQEDKNLLGLYIAAMVKYSLENKVAAENPLTADLNASKIVLAYCNDPKNNFKLKKKYRKRLENN